MAALLVALAVMSLLLSMAMPAWRTLVKREKEEELLFRLKQYAHALALYQRRLPGASPANLALKLLERGRIEGLTGVNLPMLLRALTYREKGWEVLLARARDGGRDGIINMLDH